MYVWAVYSASTNTKIINQCKHTGPLSVMPWYAPLKLKQGCLFFRFIYAEAPSGGKAAKETVTVTVTKVMKFVWSVSRDRLHPLPPKEHDKQ